MMLGMFPPGLRTKTITFGRYSNGLGSNQSGSVRFGFDEPLLHVPSGQVVVSGMETINVEDDTGTLSVTVPVTVTDDLVGRWKSDAPVKNVRLKVDVDIVGYHPGVAYLDIHASDPMIFDYDFLTPYSTPSALPVLRASVSSVAGLTGDITRTRLAAELGVGGLLKLPVMNSIKRLEMSNGWTTEECMDNVGTVVLDTMFGRPVYWAGARWQDFSGAAV